MNPDSLSQKDQRRFLRYAVTATIIAIGVVFSFTSYRVVQRQEAARVQSDFDRGIDAYTNILQDALFGTETDIASVAGFFSTRNEIGRQEFRAFVQPIMARHPGTWAIVWLPRVAAADRQAFELAARESISPDYEIKERDSEGNLIPAREREQYFPVLFAETVQISGNFTPWGMDPTTGPERGPAYLEAMSTGLRSATVPLKPVSPAFTDQFAIAAIQPIYDSGKAINTIDERRAAIKGFIVDIFRTGTLVETAISGLNPRGLDFYLFDAEVTIGDQPIYYHASRTRSRPVAPQSQETLRSGLHALRELNMAGRKWLAIFKPAPGFFVGSTWQEVMVLVGGLLLTGLLALYQYTILTRSARVSELAMEQTKALRSSERELRDAVSVVTSGLVMSDEAGAITQFNTHAENLFGYKASEIIGKNVAILTTESDRSNHGKYMANYLLTGQAKILGKGREVVARRKNGEEFPAHLGIGEISRPGHKAFIACITDISDQVWANREIEKGQRQLEALADANPSLVSHVGRDLKYRYVNRAYAEWFGKSADKIVGLTVPELHGEEEYQRLKPFIKAALSGEEQSFSVKLDALESGERWIQGSLIPDIDPEGNINGYFVFTNDVTELKRQEAQLHQAQKMESVGQLTGGVAHDFNNLLGIIQGNLSLLLDDLMVEENCSPDDLLELVKPALDASLRGAALIDRLLAFSRKKAIQPEPLEINVVIGGLKALLRRTLGDNIDLHFNLNAMNWVTEADVSHFESALLNLAVNARDAMSGGGRLTIETNSVMLDDKFVRSHTDLAAGDYVLLTVSDTGQGMELDVLDRVFEPFFTTKDVGRGTGLGLSMVYGFAKQSDGHVMIDSKPNQGTTVKLYLPRKKITISELTETDQETDPIVGSRHIRVVEDVRDGI